MNELMKYTFSRNNTLCVLYIYTLGSQLIKGPRTVQKLV